MSLLQMLLLIGGSTSIAVSSKFYTHWQQWERERKIKGAATKLQVSCRRLGWGEAKVNDEIFAIIEEEVESIIVDQ
jgi:hypothetical protein